MAQASPKDKDGLAVVNASHPALRTLEYLIAVAGPNVSLSVCLSLARLT